MLYHCSLNVKLYMLAGHDPVIFTVLVNIVIIIIITVWGDGDNARALCTHTHPLPRYRTLFLDVVKVLEL